MSTTTETTAQTGAEPGTSNSGQTGGTPPAQQQGGNDGTTFTQAQVNAFIGARLKEARTKWDEEQRSERERVEREAAAKEAAELGEWKTVAETHEARVRELEGALKKNERDLLATRIAAKYNLPETIAARLQGDDAAAMETDAKELAKLIVPAASSGAAANGASGRGERQLSKEQLRGMTPSQVAALDPAVVRAALSS